MTRLCCKLVLMVQGISPCDVFCGCREHSIAKGILTVSGVSCELVNSSSTRHTISSKGPSSGGKRIG